ncbi:hypothetical protein [Arsukibacterium sp.]|uniref:hypothetical protein n=1 Tax=Arsukibacterium sp. TaxID=1977258 RepID=UPI002FD8D6A6
MPTQVDKFISDLDGGQLEEKLSKVLSMVAGAVMDHNAAGEVVIKLGFNRLSIQQVMVTHEVKFTRPTQRGKQSEHEKMQTPMYVGEKGALSFFPEKQTVMFGKKGDLLSKE